MQFKSTLFALTLGLISCSQTEKVQVLSSLPDTDSLLVEKEILFGKDLKKNTEIIRISAADTCQTVHGVGAALTPHVGLGISSQSDACKTRLRFSENACTPAGIGINYTRLAVGASDFSFNFFSYSEPKILHFQISRLLRIIKM